MTPAAAKGLHEVGTLSGRVLAMEILQELLQSKTNRKWATMSEDDLAAWLQKICVREDHNDLAAKLPNLRAHTVIGVMRSILDSGVSREEVAAVYHNAFVLGVKGAAQRFFAEHQRNVKTSRQSNRDLN